MSARDLVATALAGLDRPLVDGRMPQQIDRPTFVLGVRRVEPAGIARMRNWTLDLFVLTPYSSAGVEDDLEQALAEVLDALDAAQPITWTSAERVPVQDDAYHAYEVTVTVTTQEV